LGSLVKDSGGAVFVPFLISTVSFHGVLFALVFFFLREHGVGWSQAFGFNAPRGVRALLLSVVTIVVVLPAAWVLGRISAEIMTVLQLEPVPQKTVTTLQQTVRLGPQVYMAVMAVLIAPTAEELLFRGILYPACKQLGFPRLALWGTALLFGAVHANLMTLIPLTLLAVALTLLYEATENLLAPIFAHSLFNLANFFFLMLDRTTT
jgi:membrane protease YdiL (CAAX protease family)